MVQVPTHETWTMVTRTRRRPLTLSEFLIFLRDGGPITHGLQTPLMCTECVAGNSRVTPPPPRHHSSSFHLCHVTLAASLTGRPSTTPRYLGLFNERGGVGGHSRGFWVITASGTKRPHGGGGGGGRTTKTHLTSPPPIHRD